MTGEGGGGSYIVPPSLPPWLTIHVVRPLISFPPLLRCGIVLVSTKPTPEIPSIKYHGGRNEISLPDFSPFTAFPFQKEATPVGVHRQFLNSRKSTNKVNLVKRQCLLIFLLLKPGHRTFRSPDLEIKNDRDINSAPLSPSVFFPVSVWEKDMFFKESKRERMGMGRSLSACAPGWVE